MSKKKSQKKTRSTSGNSVVIFPSFLVIGAYAPEEMLKHAVPFVKQLIMDAVNKIEICADDAAKSVMANGIFADWNWTSGTCIPLILCEDRAALKRIGVRCPYEFIIERNDLLLNVYPADKNGIKPSIAGRDILRMRIAELARLYGASDRGITVGQLQDWFAGTFRKYLFLDETVHGTSGVIDAENIECDNIINHICGNLPTASDGDTDAQVRIAKAKGDAQKLINRFVHGEPAGSTGPCIEDPMIRFLEFFKKLYSKKFSQMIGVLSKPPTRRLAELKKFYTDKTVKDDGSPIPHSQRLPRPYGDRARFVSATGKMNILLIDDDPNTSPLVENAKRPKPFCREDNKLLRKTFHVEEMFIKSELGKHIGDLCRTAAKKMREYQENGLSFDIALIDLCLCDEPGGDLTGYTMIKTVRKYFPHLPIVVYSKFRDMEHIARAFWCGARWFLRKGEEDKLPRHILSMVRQPGWHREWRAINSREDAPIFKYEKPDSEFAYTFDHKKGWQYLTHKGLEYQPGRFITLRQMGGGISTACTFKATKGIRLDGAFLQNPVVIKIDASHSTMMEFERYFRMIRPYIANEAGRIERPERTLNRTCSSIVYTFAGRQDDAHELLAMSEMLKSDVLCKSSCDFEKYRFALDSIFNEILPKIHRVSPEREFGEIGLRDVYSGIEKEQGAAIRKKIESDGAEPPSAFPNLGFGECAAQEFFKSYVARMQPWEIIELKDDAVFLEQPCLKDVGKWKDCVHYEFHGIATDERDGSMFIEAYDKERHLVWIKGAYADHVARFRRQLNPGTALWVNRSDIKNKDEVCIAGESRPCLYRVDWLKDKLHNSACKDIDSLVLAFFGGECAGIKTVSLIVGLQDIVIAIARKVLNKEGKDSGVFWGLKFESPVGIVHGDLNFGNVMLEARKHAAKDVDPDKTRTVMDVWLIDFARTRRDIIAHDFNVAFTATISLLFDEELLRQNGYEYKLRRSFALLAREAITSKAKSLKDVPDAIKDDERFVFVYKILRRIRMAALDSGVSQDMYELTTALCCLYTFKIYLNHGNRVRLAVALVSVAYMCFKSLRSRMDAEWGKQLDIDPKMLPNGVRELLWGVAS